jgi:hypothetical protein
LGAKRLGSVDEQTPSAERLNILYPLLLQAILEKHPWSFARKTSTMAPVTTPHTSQYTYAYRLPDDCVSVIGLTDPTGHWEIFEGGQLHTSVSEAEVVYTAYIDSPAKMPATFREALACFLASDLAYQMTQKQAVQDRWEKKAEALLEEAKLFDFRNERAPVSQTSSFEQARFNETNPGEGGGVYVSEVPVLGYSDEDLNGGEY